MSIYDSDWIAVPNMCGDGAIDGEEECDDGNTVAGDGCYECLAECGNGVLDLNEVCDDGTYDSDYDTE